MQHSFMKHCFIFYVLPYTWPRFLHHKTKIGLIIEGAFCYRTRFYVLCFTIYLTWNNVLRFMHYLCKIPPFCPYTIVLVSFDVTFSYETMFYVLCFIIYLTWHKIIIFGLCITFAKSLPSGPRLIKVNVSFDVTFLYETMFYVLPSTCPNFLCL